MGTDLLVIAMFVIAFGLVSNRLADTSLTPHMAYVAFGIVAGGSGLGLLDLPLSSEGVTLLAEATLVLVLYSDAARLDLRVLRREAAIPARLLGIGLPLTIAAGGAAAVLLFTDLAFWEAMLIGAILAPTDAALGQVVVSSEVVPVRIRQAINVESGLNDGIALPVVTLFLALAAIEDDLESTGYWVAFLGRQIGFGLLAGLVAGVISGWVIDRGSRRGWMDGLYRQLATLAVAAAAYGLAEVLEGNGFIAAFVAGLAMGTITRDSCRYVFDFSEDEGQLLALLTFLVFGASMAGPALDELTWEIALYAVLSLTVLRMLPVAVALVGSRLRRDTVAFLGWFGPRGLASILFGLFALEEAALTNSEEVFLVVVWTVLLSVVAHGITAAPWARRYGAAHEAAVEQMAARGETMPESVSVTELPVRH